MYAADGVAAPKRLFVFTDKGIPWRWQKPPRSFVQWRSDWYVANGTQTLIRFDSRGNYLATVALPVFSTTVTATADALWVINAVAARPDQQIWRSRDAKKFEAIREHGVPDERFATPLRKLLVTAGAAGGELYISPLVGPPIIRRLTPGGASSRFQAAYSRLRSRAGLEDADGLIEDITPWSLPIRDLYAVPRGIVELFAGRRADQYDGNGRHLATAVFPQSVHWIIASTPATVTAVSRSGEMATARWGQPLAGEIIRP